MERAGRAGGGARRAVHLHLCIRPRRPPGASRRRRQRWTSLANFRTLTVLVNAADASHRPQPERAGAGRQRHLGGLPPRAAPTARRAGHGPWSAYRLAEACRRARSCCYARRPSLPAERRTGAHDDRASSRRCSPWYAGGVADAICAELAGERVTALETPAAGRSRGQSAGIVLVGAQRHGRARMTNVERWDTHEIALEAAPVRQPVPGRRAHRDLHPPRPAARRSTVDGFYDGGQTWRLRLLPLELGDLEVHAPAPPTPAWTASTGDARVRRRPRSRTCAGPLQRAGPHFFHADGTPRFLISTRLSCQFAAPAVWPA